MYRVRGLEFRVCEITAYAAYRYVEGLGYRLRVCEIHTVQWRFGKGLCGFRRIGGGRGAFWRD